jgi:hypothetical protein
MPKTRRIKIKKRGKKVRTRRHTRRKLNKKGTDPCLKQIFTLKELQDSKCLKFYKVTSLADDRIIRKTIREKYIDLKDYIESNHNAIYEKNKNGCFEKIIKSDIKIKEKLSPFDYFIIESIGRYRPDYNENGEDITDMSYIHFDNATINIKMDNLHYDEDDETCYKYHDSTI